MFKINMVCLMVGYIAPSLTERRTTFFLYICFPVYVMKFLNNFSLKVLKCIVMLFYIHDPSEWAFANNSDQQIKSLNESKLPTGI